MHNAPISNLFNIQTRFLRSVQLERDFSDPQSLKGYVLTPQTKQYVERLSKGLRDNSGQRAWRITGDYGSGKSSFALFLAHLMSGEHTQLPTHLRTAIKFKDYGISRPRLLPVLVTGSQEPLAAALLRALHRDLLRTCDRGRLPAVIDRIEAQLKKSAGTSIPEDAVLQLLKEACAYVVAADKAVGLLILLDELGKFLEYGALHPERQDVFLLQVLAETAARSARTPLFIIGLLHQGFNAYSEHLSHSAQKEWEKVAGRFDELLFSQPVAHTTMLIADALNIKHQQLPKQLVSEYRQDMTRLLDLGWYGATAAKSDLIELAPRLYPLHPSVIPVLIQLFSSFGQNERSLFSFLVSNEPFGLQEFATRPMGAGQFYRIHDLYDYARCAFGHRLSRQSFRNHWNHIDSMIESFPVVKGNELQILKTVGLINLLDNNAITASDSMLMLSTACHENQIKSDLRRLRSRRVLYHRGVAGGYCLWPNTSVNLDRSYDSATKALAQTPQRVAAQIQPYLDTRPVVARRHYIETGNLRHFDVRFSTIEQMDLQLKFDEDVADGRIIVALCETEDEREQALSFTHSKELQSRPEILCAVPSPLRALGKLVQELQRWEWVAAHTPELNNDSFAAEEVSRQLSASRDALQQRLSSFIGLQQSGGGSELTWFRTAKKLPIRNGRDLLSYLSNVCDELYPEAPWVPNELVNRRRLSSAAAAARMRLIEGMFSSPSAAYLGMDPAKKPPEMSIYLSLLKNAGLHVETPEGWTFNVPKTSKDCCHVRPVLQKIEQIFDSARSSRVRVSEILQELKRRPFGVRDGLAPILLSVFAVMNEQHVAFYDNGMFMRQMRGLDLMRLTKLPEAFEMQFCKMAGVRTLLFERLLKVLELSGPRKSRADILDVVRPLCVFASQLPLYTQKTKNLSQHAIAVRTALLASREPAILVFRDLPSACGFQEFTTEKPRNSKEADMFVTRLKDALDELRIAYPLLLQRIRTELTDAFDFSSPKEDFRDIFRRRSQAVMLAVTELRLKAFCNRLVDSELPESEWLESLGSLVCSVPPARWSDMDADRYSQELRELCSRFRRVENIVFRDPRSSPDDFALRLSITQQSGSEIERVVYLSAQDRQAVSKIEDQVASLLRNAGTVGIAAATQALWNVLSNSKENMSE